MKNNILLIFSLILIAAGILFWLKPGRNSPTPVHHSVSTESQVAHSSHQTQRVPAYQTKVAAGQLPTTLPPNEFIGKTREAYEAAREIPETLAQLPCYCQCDLGFGHKSLHSCFEDDHASHCAVCVDEALLAYKLSKEQKLTPEQIRQTIIAQYSAE